MSMALFAASLILGLSWTQHGTASADPLSDAKTQLNQLEADASALSEQYDQALAKSNAAQAQLDQTKLDITNQEQAVATLRSQVAMIALGQFQDRGMTSAAVLLTAASTTDAISDFTTSQQVTSITNAVLQNYQLQQAALKDLQLKAQTLVTSLAADQASMASLKDAADAKVAAQQTVVRKLTAAQQAALAAQQAANVTPPASKPPSSYSPPPPVTNGAAAATIVAFAMAHVGGRYVYGGSGPSSYDCSGFAMAAYALVGIALPHSASAQYRLGKPVAYADLEPGDLVFFYSGPSHVGIYVGGGMMVDAANPTRGIVYRQVTQNGSYTGARRLLS